MAEEISTTEATTSVEATVRDIRRKIRKKYSAEEKVRIVLEGLRGEEKIGGQLAFLHSFCCNSMPFPENFCGSIWMTST